MLWSTKNHGATLDVALRRGGLLLVVALALTVAGAASVRAQSKAATPAGSETPPVVRYVGMRQGRVGEPFMLRARVRDGATAAPLAGAPLVFTVGDREIEAVTGPNGIAEATMVLTADLAEARVTVTYKGAAGSGSGLLAAQSDAGGSAGATAQVEAASLTPTALTATVAAGQSVTETKVAALPAPAVEPGDIVFAFDATESMSSHLPSVKGVAEDIMLGLTADGLDVVFGVTAHQDYAGNYASFGYASPVGYGEAGNSAYRLAQTLTADVDQVVAALDTVTAEPAGDPPGSYSRALYETVAELGGSADPEQGALGYRAGARKMVALFGDDLPHDNDLNEGVPGKSGVFTTGGDPGRDGILQETSNPAGIGVGNDDLNWQTVIGLMGSRQVNLLSYELNPFYSDYWSHWASETGGELVYDYDMLLDGIRGRLLGSSAAGTVRLRPTAGYESWVTTAPGSYTDVALPASLPFEVTITPPVGTAPGVYSFSIELVADNQVLAAQSVQLTVSGQSNRAPVAVDDAYSVLEDSVGNVLDVLANDSDADGDVLAVASVGSAGHGTVTLTGGVVRYTPVANYHGPDSFSYTVSDGALTATATANLTVQPVNDAPVAVDDAYSVLEDSVENVLDVLANDSDVDGDVLAVASVGSAAHGTVTLTGGVVRYTPAPDYSGPDGFSYTVSDGALTAAATANLTVQPVNDAPLAVDDAFTVAEDSVENVLDVLGNDSDVDGDVLAVTGVGSAGHGIVTLTGGLVRYTPAPDYSGPDGFSYTVSDGTLTATANVSLTIVGRGKPQLAFALVAERSGANSDGVVTVGQPITLVATITNTGQTALRLIPLYMSFDPAVVRLVSSEPAPDQSDANRLIWHDVTGPAWLPAGQKLTIRLVMQATGSSQTLPGRVMVMNGSIEGATDEYDQVLGQNAASSPVRVTAPGLSVLSAIVDPANGIIDAGELVTVTVQIRASGDTTITHLPLQDLYDDKALTFLGASVGGYTVGGGAVTWNNLAAQAGNVAPGQTVAANLVYRLEQPLVSVTRQAKVEGARDEHADVLPTATAATTFFRPALELSMTAEPASGTRVEAGGTIRYDLVLQNTGGVSLSNIAVSALLTGDGVFATVETPGTGTPGPCPVAPGQPNDDYRRTFQLAQLAPGASCALHLKVQAGTTLVTGSVRLQVEANAPLLRRPAAVEALHMVGRSGPGIGEFTALATAEGIRLVWKTAEENGVTGFHLWRGEYNDRTAAKRITAAPIVPKGKPGSSYAFVEFPLLYDHSYFYWLEVVRTDGNAEVGPVSARIASSMRAYIALVLAEANLTQR